MNSKYIKINLDGRDHLPCSQVVNIIAETEAICEFIIHKVILKSGTPDSIKILYNIGDRSDIYNHAELTLVPKVLPNEFEYNVNEKMRLTHGSWEKLEFFITEKINIELEVEIFPEQI